jgi:hypothetical protein
MKLFYSWQSDSDTKLNRYFIQKALENISKTYQKEALPELVIDQATREEPGSPNISETIFRKIDECNLFVADVSIINPNSQERKTPNPNVLIELGYAIRTLGFKNIILLFNAYYGTPNDLPFDIRQHRILQYNSDSKKNEDVFNRLIKDLTIAIMTIEKKSVSSNKIEIVFCDNSEEYGNSIDIKRIKYLPISKKDFLDSVEEDKIKPIPSEKRSIWQEYLFKAIGNDRSRKEALKKMPRGMPLVEHRFFSDFTNLNYFEEYLNTALARENILSINFMLKNNNEKAFEKIKIVFSFDRNIPILRYIDFPEYPRESKLDVMMIRHSISSSSLFVFREDNFKKYFEYDIDILHIGESFELKESLFVQLHEKNEPIIVNYIIYFMDMPQINGKLTVNAEITEETINPYLVFSL